MVQIIEVVDSWNLCFDKVFLCRVNRLEEAQRAAQNEITVNIETKFESRIPVDLLAQDVVCHYSAQGVGHNRYFTLVVSKLICCREEGFVHLVHCAFLDHSFEVSI